MFRIYEKRKISGFTLIEVLISMFVFGYGIMSVISFMEASYTRTFKIKKMAAAARTFSYIENYIETVSINDPILIQGTHYVPWDTIFGSNSIEKDKIYADLGKPIYPPVIMVIDYVPSAGKLYKIIRIHLFDNRAHSWWKIPYETYTRGM